MPVTRSSKLGRFGFDIIDGSPEFTIRNKSNTQTITFGPVGLEGYRVRMEDKAYIAEAAQPRNPLLAILRTGAWEHRSRMYFATGSSIGNHRVVHVHYLLNGKTKYSVSVLCTEFSLE